MLRVPQYYVEHGPAPLLAHDESFLRVETARATMARLLGADTDEIAFTTQFSTAVSILTEGLPGKQDRKLSSPIRNILPCSSR